MDNIAQRSADKSAFIQVLQTVDDRSCPTDYNFHLHTQHSDGQSDPIDLFQQAIALGLKGLAITDHHSLGGYHALCQWLQTSEHPLELLPHLWTGVEITATLLDCDVHILGFAFDPQSSGIAGYLTGQSVQGERRTAKAVIASIHQAGGVAILAHPARYRTQPSLLIEQAVKLGLDGVEAFYCYGQDHPWAPSEPQTSQIQALGDRFQLLQSCGTDTHGLDITRRR